METQLSGLLPFEQLKNVHEMARLLADAVAAQKKLLIVADYDADGATACAVRYAACVLLVQMSASSCLTVSNTDMV